MGSRFKGVSRTWGWNGWALLLLFFQVACATSTPRVRPLGDSERSPASRSQAGVARDEASDERLHGYMALLVAPEPVSKGVAAALTVLLWGYLGWEFFDLIRAYFQLWEEAAEASTFGELREAGERFGKVIGPNSVRILVMLGTAAVSTRL